MLLTQHTVSVSSMVHRYPNCMQLDDQIHVMIVMLTHKCRRQPAKASCKLAKLRLGCAKDMSLIA
jgi:hypothetical protein